MELIQRQAPVSTDSASPAHALEPAQPRDNHLRGPRKWLDRGAQFSLAALAAAIGVLLLAMIALLSVRAWPLLRGHSLAGLLTGGTWAPHNDQFGFAPFVIGSVAVTFTAMLLAVVPAVFSGIYLAEYTTQRARARLRPLLDVLVGLPSVIFGLWGVLLVVPLIRDWAGPALGSAAGAWLPLLAFTNPSGYSVLAGGAVLAIMVYPLIASVVDEVMRSAPQEMREVLLALGATRWEATRVIVRRRGLPGILAAIVLGFSRAYGETLAVLMVVGNLPRVPHSIFDAAYPLPALIANNYGEMMSVPLYDAALMGAALLLLLVVMIFNVAARLVIMRLSKQGG